MATIKQIDGRSIHQLQSGQVIVDLCSVVKELVENSIDAGASAVDVRFKNQGLESIEVQDNGSGISPANYSSVALKHFTSKLSSYSDISSLQTFGFRGEALASLCALSSLTVSTCLSQDVPKGTKLTFEPSGKLQDTSVTAAQRGTTVYVENLFHNLPVRRRELDRNIKREWQRVMTLLHQYACIQINVKFSVSHQPSKGKRILLFSTKGNPSVRDNIINIFGAKTMTALLTLDLSMEIKPSARPYLPTMAGSSSEPRDVRVIGHVSRPIHGEGRHTPDRQMFFVNGRPCALPQFAKAFNEVYRLYSSSHSPFILADIRLDTDLYDVNVSPDKRSILLHDQNHLLDRLRISLTDLFDTHDYSLPLVQPSRIANRHSQESCVSAAGPVVQKRNIKAEELSSMSEVEVDIDDDHNNDHDAVEDSLDEPQGRTKAMASALRHRIRQQNQSLVTMFARQESDLKLQSGSSSSPAISGSLVERDRTTPLDIDECGEVSISCEPISPQLSSPSLIKDLEPHSARPTISSNPNSKSSGERTPSPEGIARDGKSQTMSFGNNYENALNFSPTRSRSNLVGWTHAKSPSSAAKPAISMIQTSMLQHDTNDVESTSCSSTSAPQVQETCVQASIDPPLNDAFQPANGPLPVTEEDIEPRHLRPAFNDRNEQSSPKAIFDDKKMANIAVESSTQMRQSHSRQKDATAHLLQHLHVTEQRMRCLIRDVAHQTPMWPHSGVVTRQVEEIAAADAESKLPLIIAKSDFAQMRIAGQFNLGFILAVRPARMMASGKKAGCDELFIIDQHASDEKYNFERLQNSTTIQTQRLVHPKRLQLTALEEEILLENTSAIEANGFKVDIDTTGRLPIGSRCQLIALPLSRETAFNVEDLEELISLLGDSSPESSQIPRPSKVRRMLAMRACRSSVMIGKALTRSQMYGLVKHMGELDRPWNCPHGRPTMRHLIRLQHWDGTGWNADLDGGSLDNWGTYLSEGDSEGIDAC